MKLKNAAGETVDVRSPFTGRLRTISLQAGSTVQAGAEVAVVDPGTEQVWEALRALHVVGQLRDLPAILPFQRELPDIPDRIRQQAAETEAAIRQRAM